LRVNVRNMKRGQPYVGAFLFKDDNADGDVIEKLDDVYDTGGSGLGFLCRGK
jgi:hypothetical protein